MVCMSSTKTRVSLHSTQCGHLKGVQEDPKCDHNHQQIVVKRQVESEMFPQIDLLQAFHGVRVKISLPLDTLVRQDIIEPGNITFKQIRAPWCDKAKFLPVNDLRWQILCSHFLENVLLNQ